MSAKPLIAVIEDDPDIAEIVRFALESEGCDVRTARDGMAGLTLVSTCKPDLVLLDVAMPKKDGLQVLADVRRNTRIAQMPIIMMTARNRGEDVSAALASGADDYLVKPFELGALLAKVRRRLGGRVAARGAPARPDALRI